MHNSVAEADLRQMRVGIRYKGYHCVLIAVDLCLEYEGNPLRITKDLYPVIAKRTGLKWQAVEQNIMYVARKCWQNGKTYLSEIAGYPLTQQPSNLEFIDILVNHALRAGTDCKKSQ